MQSPIELPPKTRGLTAIAGAMALIAVLLIVQIWLLSAALESFLAGNHHTALPAAVFSGVMFLIASDSICSLTESIPRFAAPAKNPDVAGSARTGFHPCCRDYAERLNVL